MKRSTEKKDPIGQLLDILGPDREDVPEFCLTDLNIEVGKDPEDVRRAAGEILTRVQRELVKERQT